jgi:hypothetical protein
MLEGNSLSVIHESLSMMRVIVAFGREEHEYRRFREQTETAVKARVRVTVKQTLFSLCVNMITAAGDRRRSRPRRLSRSPGEDHRWPDARCYRLHRRGL